MRRYKELIAKGQEVNFEDVLRELVERDTADSSRAVAPLKPAEDAHVFDNSDYTFEGSVEYIIKHIEEKTGVSENEK
jgi:cytidylate kinase